ncbi:AraC family transcriptional regulator [Allomuricauda sp. NBRC 101325]|uniref:helix-turn-helix domain-containing protein n=1 Tax=Allomuricauda sp. NBRC 101325 TaxID=1113758 RepID=UPI0024A30E8F|nr:helix-turn-helix domain-containing protein [Muricauda sp. NBRC 101325]GLU45148.1 AraC family transcriptional regulator [Muricauda sp. NBRC 101325]
MGTFVQRGIVKDFFVNFRMQLVENLEDFYKRKFDWIPDNLKNEIGHFNIFNLETYAGKNARPIPYKRRDFYKIMLVKGSGTVHYADKVLEVQKQALSFSNPHIPYKWESTENIWGGVYCIFDRHFFKDFGSVDRYEVFQPQGEHIFELSDIQLVEVEKIFDTMIKEIQSDYAHKYDVLRNLVYELIHYAMKIQPVQNRIVKSPSASTRIASLFMELLERQFPVDEDHRQINLRTASDFAQQLNVHVNHLNRAVKEHTQKTTTSIIKERILKESKLLLRKSHWDIAEIAYALDFKEPTHFSNFIKKHLQVSPTQFRNN